VRVVVDQGIEGSQHVIVAQVEAEKRSFGCQDRAPGRLPGGAATRLYPTNHDPE
jgi:hypothetical protein